MSFGKSKQKSTQEPARVDPVQSPYLTRLYRSGQNVLPDANANVAALNPAVQQSMQQLLNPGVSPQLDAYSNQVMRQFNNDILPAIQSNAGMVNQMGGARQQIAQGVAAGQANENIANAAASLYGQDMDRMLDAIGYAGQAATLPQQPYVTQGAILGNPTVLSGGGQSRGRSKSKSL